MEETAHHPPGSPGAKIVGLERLWEEAVGWGSPPGEHSAGAAAGQAAPWGRLALLRPPAHPQLLAQRQEAVPTRDLSCWRSCGGKRELGIEGRLQRFLATWRLWNSPMGLNTFLLGHQRPFLPG